MTLFLTVWTVLCGIVGLVWLSRHLELNSAKKTERILGSNTWDGPPTPTPRLSMLVAAKDEEDYIETCVRTLLDQDYPNYEVIVINDRSEDRTREILDRIKAEGDERLKVIHVETLPEGWFGKNHAMALGVAEANGDYFCFTDADCRQTSKRTLSVAVREAHENGVDFLSVLPVLETRSFWERLMQPVCSAILMIWFDPRKVNNPKRKTAYANGAFMLMSRKCYEGIGGHEAAKAEMNEDMVLATKAKHAGYRLNVIQNEDLYKTHMYSSFEETWRGWTRIFRGCFRTLGRLIATILLLSFASLMPWLTLCVSVVAACSGSVELQGRWTVLAIVSGCTVLIMQTVLFRFYRMARSHPGWSFGYFPGACIGFAMIVKAMLMSVGAAKVVWRGTSYNGASDS